VITDLTRVCEVLIGLPDVNVLGVVDHPGGALEVHVESRLNDRECVGCGRNGRVKDRSSVELVDLPCFGRPTGLVWVKFRLWCPKTACEVLSWVVTTAIAVVGAVRVWLDSSAGGSPQL
jgi:transposase